MAIKCSAISSSATFLFVSKRGIERLRRRLHGLHRIKQHGEQRDSALHLLRHSDGFLRLCSLRHGLLQV